MDFLNLGLFKKEIPSPQKSGNKSTGRESLFQAGGKSLNNTRQITDNFSQFLKPNLAQTKGPSKQTIFSAPDRGTPAKLVDGLTSSPKERTAKNLGSVKETLDRSSSPAQTKMPTRSPEPKKDEKDVSIARNEVGDNKGQASPVATTPKKTQKENDTTDSGNEKIDGESPRSVAKQSDKKNNASRDTKEILQYLGGTQNLIVHYPSFKILAGEADSIPEQAMENLTSSNSLIAESLTIPSADALTQNGPLRNLLTKLGIPEAKLAELEKLGFNLQQPMRMDALLQDFGFNPKIIGAELEKLKLRINANIGLSQNIEMENLLQSQDDSGILGKNINPNALKAIKTSPLNPTINTNLSELGNAPLNGASGAQYTSPVASSPVNGLVGRATNPAQVSSAPRFTADNLISSAEQNLNNDGEISLIARDVKTNLFNPQRDIKNLSFAPSSNLADMPLGDATRTAENSFASLDILNQLEQQEQSINVPALGEKISEVTSLKGNEDKIRTDANILASDDDLASNTFTESLAWRKYFGEKNRGLSSTNRSIDLATQKHTLTEPGSLMGKLETPEAAISIPANANFDEPQNSQSFIMKNLLTSNFAPIENAVPANASQLKNDTGLPIGAMARELGSIESNLQSGGSHKFSENQDSGREGQSKNEMDGKFFAAHQEPVTVDNIASKNLFAQKTDLNDVYNAIAVKSKEAQSFRGGTLSLSLNNSSVGPLDLKIDVTGNNVAIDFSDIDKQASAMIRHDLPQLKEALAQHGLTLNNTTFNTESFSKGGFAGFAQQNQQQGFDQQRGESAPDYFSKSRRGLGNSLKRDIYPKPWHAPTNIALGNSQVAVLV